MIRYITPLDHAKYRVIRMEALSTDPDAFGETFEVANQRSEAGWIEWVSKVIIPERKNVICIESDGNPIAMCGFGLSDEDAMCGFIWGMFVSLAYRRKDYGKKMLEEAETWIKRRGGERVRACVAVPNQTAVEFYRQCGYVIGLRSGTLRPDSTIPVYPIEKDFCS